MLEGWTRQQQTRFLKWEPTIKPRLSLVRRFAVFTGQYPWEWEPAEVEAFFARIRADNPGFTMSSGRQYQNSLRMFMDFICDPRYGWLSACLERFGRTPAQILHEWNSVTHVTEFEGQPGRRPLTYDEVQALFDAADGMAEGQRAPGRQGALTARRDAAPPEREPAGLPAELDLHSLRHSMMTHVVEFGYPERFAQDQAGDAVAATTAIYTGVSDEYRTRLLKSALTGRYPGLWEDATP